MSKFIKGNKDTYSGFYVDEKEIATISVEQFTSMLPESLDEWRKIGIRGVWLKIGISRAELIPIALKNGFGYHHADPSYLMLTIWLPDPKVDTNKMPNHASHYVGSAGACVDLEKQEILIITEKYRTGHDPALLQWKLPGGTLDPNEDIAVSAVREVWEETGVKAEFVGVLGFRHMHNFKFGKGDFYFVSLLKPITKELNPDKGEIDQCEWVPLETFYKLNLNMVQSAARDALRAYLEGKGTLMKISDISQFKYKSALWYSPSQ